MSGLRETIARAIMEDQGASILRPEEVDHLMRAAWLCDKHGYSEQCQTLRDVAIELGSPKAVMFIHKTGEDRIADYYYHCADLVIKAYDAWLARAARERHECP